MSEIYQVYLTIPEIDFLLDQLAEEKIRLEEILGDPEHYRADLQRASNDMGIVIALTFRLRAIRPSTKT